MSMQGISWSGVLVRIVLAVVLVLATYNPTGYSFFHWLTAPSSTMAVKALLGMILLIGWVVCLRTVYVALGGLGVSLGTAFLAALVWVFIEMKWINLATPSAIAWVSLLILGVILGVGLSWSLIRARLTGQIEVE